MKSKHCAPWYLREDYERIRAIMDDGQKLPIAFDEWEQVAKNQAASAAAAGITIQPVILRPDEFLAYCQAEKLQGRGSRERSMYAIARASAGKLN